jgi:hypothetical protein
MECIKNGVKIEKKATLEKLQDNAKELNVLFKLCASDSVNEKAIALIGKKQKHYFQELQTLLTYQRLQNQNAVTLMVLKNGYITQTTLLNLLASSR